MGLELLKEKAKENFKTAQWAERKMYYDVAVSRYYYCAFERIIYISKKEGFYTRPIKGENSHIKTIDEFMKNINVNLSSEDKVTLLKMKKLRKIRSDADYDEKKLGTNEFMLVFKYHFNEIIDIIDKLL